MPVKNRTHPLQLLAAAAVVLFSLVGTAAIMGWLPSSVGGTANRQLTEAAFATLDGRLTDHEWLAGDTYSIADIATFGWTHIARVIDFDISAHQHLSGWYQRVAARPAVQRGIALPSAATGA